MKIRIVKLFFVKILYSFLRLFVIKFDKFRHQNLRFFAIKFDKFGHQKVMKGKVKVWNVYNIKEAKNNRFTNLY